MLCTGKRWEALHDGNTVNTGPSFSSKINRAAAPKNTTINQNTECIGLSAEITIIPDFITPNANL